MQDPFTLEEVYTAVRQLAKNKASGPDGLPNEFLQNYWKELSGEVMRIIDSFYQQELDFRDFNRANIVRVPKKEVPSTVNDYRPISIINVIPKLISKIIVNRLRRVLPNLISIQQTAFISGQQISENFNSTREILQHISSTSRLAIFAKLDFTKAFDSVNWSFLRKVMIARGFPERCIVWIMTLLPTASSRVIINGEP